ncbi:hypothetical protein LSAT2_018839 [Lamellibrachia satsuma]|nr:hypothetical protein LSAT2_018839 [Lamellibrachia satsuma]
MNKCLSVGSTSINNSRNPSQDVSIANIRGMSTISRVPTDIASPSSSLLPLTNALSSQPRDSSTTTASSRNQTYSVEDVQNVPGGSEPEWESYVNGQSAPHSDSSRTKEQSPESDSSSVAGPLVVEQFQTGSSGEPIPAVRTPEPPPSIHTAQRTPSVQTKHEKDELNAVRASFRQTRSRGPPVLAERKFWV